jgi:ABC-2 type transport system permease protein
VLAPFVGVFYPLAVLPAWMQYIARALPPSYVFEGMRGILEGTGASSFDALAGLGLSLVYLALAYLFFMNVYRTVLRRGLIARFSAEGA